MASLWYALAAVFVVSLASFSGAFTLALKKKSLRNIITYLVAFAAGGMLGAAFLDLFPESLALAGKEIFWYALIGIVTFFILEKYMFWHHCHHSICAHTHHKHTIQPLAWLNLVGDGLHNFIDGIIIAVAFIESTRLGLIVTLAVMLHEIPQELGDFGVLVYAGLKPVKALLLNFVTALTAVIGTVFGYFFGTAVAGANTFLLPFAAGTFLYIAATDLMPTMQHEEEFRKNVQQLGAFLAGIALMVAVTALTPQIA